MTAPWSGAPTSTVATGEWRTETLRADDALAGLAGEWEDLYRRCSTATPMTSYSWLESWWRSYGRSGRLVVVLVRRAGRLVGAAALTRRNRGILAVLSAAGTGISDFCDVLLDDSCAAEAAGHLARELAARAGGQVIDLPEVPPGAAAWRVADAWPGRLWQVPGSICLEVSARSMDELIRSLPRDTARTRRNKRRRIKAVGIQARVTSSQEAAAATAMLLRLHREQWRGRGINPEHRRRRFAAHLARALPAMVERGQAVLLEYRLDGQLVVVDLLVVGRRTIYAYLYGYRPDVRRRIDVSQLLMEKDLELLEQFGCRAVNLMRGDEPHKRQWLPRETRNQRVLLAVPGRPLAPLYTAGVRGRYRLAVFVKTRLPRVARTVRSARRCLRYFT